MQDAICEGLGPVGERTLLGERIRQRRDRQARPGLHVDAATVASDRFIHQLAAAGGGQGRSGATSFAMLDPCLKGRDRLMKGPWRSGVSRDCSRRSRARSWLCCPSIFV
jgi:hypothetical protein